VELLVANTGLYQALQIVNVEGKENCF